MQRFARAVLLVMSGCGSTGSVPSDAAPPLDASADAAGDGAADAIRGTGTCSHVEIAYFVATPSTIDRGATATLSWDGRMARACDLEPGNVGFGGGPGSFGVAPTSTTEYSLRCFATACLDPTEGPLARVTVTVR